MKTRATNWIIGFTQIWFCLIKVYLIFGSQVKLLPYLKSFKVSMPKLVKMPHSPVSFLNLDWK